MPSAPRVLVVDDDAMIRETLAEALADEGYLAEMARDGREALGVVRASPPDLILLDLMMPFMDGWTFARQCHETPEGADIPIVVLSAARGLNEEAERLKPFGVRAAVAKPYNLDELLTTVGRYLPSNPD